MGALEAMLVVTAATFVVLLAAFLAERTTDRKRREVLVGDSLS
jgi:hypothetical protein